MPGTKARKSLFLIAVFSTPLILSCNGENGKEDGTDALDIPTDPVQDDGQDTPSDLIEDDARPDPHDCINVSYFECGFMSTCEDGVISAEWHEHVFTGDVEDIIFYDCTHVCEFGCSGEDPGWPESGEQLVAIACAQAPPEEEMEEIVPEEIIEEAVEEIPEEIDAESDG